MLQSGTHPDESVGQDGASCCSGCKEADSSSSSSSSHGAPITQSIAWHALTITQLPATSSCGGVDNPRSSSSGFNVFSVGYCLIIIFSSELPRPIMCCCVVNCSAAHSAVACWFESQWSVYARGCSDVNKDLSQKYQDFGAEDMD